MPFQRPTLLQIIQRAEGDLKTALNIVSILRRSFLAAIARMVAGASHVLHGHMVFISKQIFPDQAEDEFARRWGSIYGIEQNPAEFAQLEIDVTFSAAGTVPALTIWQRTDSVEYVTDADIDALGAGVETGTITAKVAGDAGNHNNGEVVALQSPITNVSGDALVSSTVVEGEDQESIEAYRQRIVDRIQAPPAGGTVEDYKAFAKSVTGVTRVWVLPGYIGEGTVGVSFVEDDDVPIIPDAASVAAVQLAVDLQKPVTANAIVFAPIDNVTDLNISIKPNTVAVRDIQISDWGDKGLGPPWLYWRRHGWSVFC